MKLLDANFILRFLLDDHPLQSIAAKKVLEANNETLLLHDLAVAEIVWVLTSVYKLEKKDIAEKIYHLLRLKSILSNKSLLIRSIYFYRNFTISFIDAYFAAYSEQEKLEGIYSFDKDLDKIKEVKRFEPK